MSFDEQELRRALEARSGEVSPEYRARLRHAVAGAAPAAGHNWMAAIAVVVVTLLTATSVGVLLASRRAGHQGPVASGPRVTSPTPVSQAKVQLSAPSSNVVWALVDSASLFRSTDRGDHWEQRSLPSDFGVRPSISFINDSEGWLLAPGSPTSQCGQAGAALWHTTNGAATWSLLPAQGIREPQCKEVVNFIDSQRGFISAWDDNNRPTVYFSLDRGYTWKRSALPDPPDFKTLPGGFTLRVQWIKQVGGTLYLEAYGEQGAGTPYPDIPDRQYIFTSTDFGGTWAWKQKVPSRSLVIVTPARWLELDAPGRLGETLDGGHSTAPFNSDIDPNTPADGTVIVFGDADVGYIAAGGSIQRTNNGGRHWAPVATPWSAQFTPAPVPSPTPIPLPTEVQMSAPTSNVVWAYVCCSVLFVSTDRGDSWQTRSLPEINIGGLPIAISFVDASNGWLSTCPGSKMTLWRTIDGARSWQMLARSPAPAPGCMRGLSFVDPTHGFISSALDDNRPPTVYRTADAGLTWSSSSLPEPPGFKTAPGYTLNAHRVVRFGAVDYLTAYGSQPDGGKGYVFRSADGGATWTFAADIPNVSVSVAFVTASRWLQVIVPGQSVETTDSGKTWHAYASDYSQAAPITPEVVFADASVGYATVRGEIQRTTDGGAHWVKIRTPGT